MTRLLAIDSATAVGSVALVEGDGATAKVVAERAVEMDRSHAIHQVSSIDQLLADHNWDKRSIEAVAVVRGPGSFTGVRIAMGTAQGVALAAGCPCLAVGTLEAMAMASGDAPRSRIALLGAGRGELFWARFEAQGEPPREIDAPQMMEESAVWSLSDGYFIYGDKVTRPDSWEPSLGCEAPQALAGAAGRLALMREGDSPPLAPHYIRPSDAELNRHRRSS